MAGVGARLQDEVGKRKVKRCHWSQVARICDSLLRGVGAPPG
jgi:hypothetical protein